MATLDEYLRSLLTRAAKKFPNAGLIIVSVEDVNLDAADISCTTNVDQDSATDILSLLLDEDEFGDDVADEPAEPAHAHTLH